MKNLVLISLLLTTPALAHNDYVDPDHVYSFTQCQHDAEDQEQMHLCEVNHPVVVICIALSDGSDSDINDCLRGDN